MHHHSQIHQQQSSWLVQITNGGGRIRVTDDFFVLTICTANVEVGAENVNAVNATQAKESSDKTQKGHFCHVKKLMQWLVLVDGGRVS